MSDISIPGVTASKYKTDQLIEGLMKVERIPRNREEEQLKTYKAQQSAWRDLNRLSTTLRDTAKNLFSFNNPFTEKNGESTNDRAVSVSATREAREQSFKLKINQVAAADSFLSSEIPRDGKVPPGSYSFAVGDKTLQFQWKGGTYQDFSDALNRRGTEMLRSSLIQVTPNTRALLIESLKTGEKHRLSFEDDAKTFALDVGLIKKDEANAIETSLSDVYAPPVSNSLVEFSSTARAKDGLVLEYRISWETTEAGETEVSPGDSGPVIGTPPVLEWKGITIQNTPSETALTQTAPPQPKVPVTDPSVVSLRSSRGQAMPLPPPPEGELSSDVSINLSEFGDVNALVIHNRNTERSYKIENIIIKDPKASNGYVPVNPVSVAQDARFTYEGIQIVRSTNSIDDLIPGVTLTLQEPTENQETITIKPDTEVAKEAIISLVGGYNRLMAEINILTQLKPEIISEIQYFTEEERKSSEEKLGMMQGDTTLNGIKSSLQRITSGSYPAIEGSALRLLSDLGISTKSNAGGGVDSARLRGYLEIDEKKLDEALKNRMPEIKSLFGLDTDGDLIIDAGVAFSIDSQLTPYVQTGGIFSTRTNGLASRITNSEKKITQLDKQLEDKEDELRNKYGKMEGTLNNLQNQSNSISNFNKQNSN